LLEPISKPFTPKAKWFYETTPLLNSYMVRTGSTFAGLILTVLGITAIAFGTFNPPILSAGILFFVVGITLLIMVMLEQYKKGKAENR